MTAMNGYVRLNRLGDKVCDHCGAVPVPPEREIWMAGAILSGPFRDFPGERFMARVCPPCRVAMEQAGSELWGVHLRRWLAA